MMLHFLKRHLITVTLSSFEPRRSQEIRRMFSSLPSTFVFRTVSFRSRILPHNSVWMEDAKLKGLEICHPQVRQGTAVYCFFISKWKHCCFTDSTTIAGASLCVIMLYVYVCVFVELRKGTFSTGSLEVS